MSSQVIPKKTIDSFTDGPLLHLLEQHRDFKATMEGRRRGLRIAAWSCLGVWVLFAVIGLAARSLCLYTMKTQVFIDGNKRAAVIFSNHFLIAHGQGFLVIPEAHVAEFKKLLVAYYEGEDAGIITAFLKDNCWKTFENGDLRGYGA